MAQTLTRVSPESVGIPSEAVAAFVEAVQQKVGGLHSFMLLRHGQVPFSAQPTPPLRLVA